VTTHVEVLQPAGRTRVWLPMPLTVDTPYQKALGNTFSLDGGTATSTNDPASANGIACVEWPDGVKPVVFLTSRVATHDHAVDLAQPQPLRRTAAAGARAAGTAAAQPTSAYARFLKPTTLLPTDGIVRETATAITRAARTDLDKARAIYEWIVDNTFHDPAVRGCGVGDIRSMLESKHFGGKSADLNALYVGLARAAGLPARDVYGLRVAKSARGFQSLGPSTATVTKAQHCRAEVFLARYGWVPVDPADVRKVALEEPPGNLPLDHDAVRKARAALFGSWEMNWIGFNFAQDVALPGSAQGKLGFFMYPQGETSAGRLDCLDPDHFKYAITAREMA
jgi:transglutaminase-like putative cysteine protease